jgi:hypothetical protein
MAGQTPQVGTGRAVAMAVSRLILMVLLSVTLDLSIAIASEAMGGGEKLEEWIHRPRERGSVRLVRAVATSSVARQVHTVSVEPGQRFARDVSIRPASAGPTRKVPQSIPESPSSPEDH